MLAFMGSRISPRKILKKNGTLICVGVPICRTGTQQYKRSEIDGGMDDRIVDVVRDDKEVLDPRSVASYEGVPLTDNHPPTFLNPANWSGYTRGHVQNCRIDELPSGEKCIVCDLVVEDGLLIDKILTNTSRELSVGYECMYLPLPDGRYKQHSIRANHVAVVGRGRANTEGNDGIRIYDSRPVTEPEIESFGELTRRYHRQNPLSVPSPSLGVQARGRTERIEVKDMARDEKPEELITETEDAFAELNARQKVAEEFRNEALEVGRKLAEKVRPCTGHRGKMR